jgi:2-polyprenyl-6-methoxyphenol hydroxylase-like FAD-dependent oxidoreductase
MIKETAVDVLICGAGAAGLTLAIDLARRGIALRLIDKLEDPFRGSRGKGIQPRTLEVYEDLGILDRIAAAGDRYPPQREYRDDGSYTESEVMEPVDPTPSEPYPLPLMVPQFLTEGVMRERLVEMGRQLEFGCELVDLQQDKDGVTARLVGNAGEEIVRTRYLVGADGGRSFVRQALGIGFPGKTLGVRAVVADVVLTGLERDAWHRFNEGSMERQISLCPLAGTGLFQIQAPIPLEGDIDLSAKGLAAMVADRTGRGDICVPSVSWASAFHMNARLADRYRVGRVSKDIPADWTVYPGHGPAASPAVIDAQRHYISGFRAAIKAQLGPSGLAPDSTKGIVEGVRAQNPGWSLEMLIPINAEAVAKELAEAETHSSLTR